MPIESPSSPNRVTETIEKEKPDKMAELLKDEALSKAADALEAFRKEYGEIRRGLPDHFFETKIIPSNDVSTFMEYLRVRSMEEELAPLLRQLTRTVTIHSGDTVLHIGSGWGKASREIVKIFSEEGLDINVVEADISSDVVDFSARTNQVQGFNERIISMPGNVLDLEGLRQPFSKNPKLVFSIGLVRYLKEDEENHELQRMLDNLLSAASEGTFFVFIDTNEPSMNKLEKEVRARGIQSYYDDEEHEKTLRYTRFYCYYCMYNNISPLAEELSDSERQAFKNAVDNEVEMHPDDYPKMDQELREILGEDDGFTDLRYMRVLADLAGYVEMNKQILIFRK